MMVIVSGQIKNKVLGNTHLFSTYPFNGACQPMISYDYIQDEVITEDNAIGSEYTYICQVQ
jgi:hypothetical protein